MPLSLDQLEELLRKINRIDDLADQQKWEINNQELPNLEYIGNAISDAVSELESIGLDIDVDRIDDEHLSDISSEVYDVKQALTEIINEMQKTENTQAGLTQSEYAGRNGMLIRTGSYINYEVTKGLTNLANAILYSPNNSSETYHNFYLLLCTLENQLGEVFAEITKIAQENEIHDLTDFTVTVKLESKRDLAKHKRNYEMEENNG